jgi:Zinc dependent phospholipase C
VKRILLAVPLLLAAGDALAWGLQTHVFFAQQLLFALPLLDPELRRAALRLPRLVLAGACLPDLALAGAALGTPRFRHTHQWAALRRLSAADCDEERAVALGYASHLLADVVAHNRFVPEHERRIADVRHLTHALAEWAMDDFLRGWVGASPGELLETERAVLGAVVARRLRCEAALAQRALGWLAGADRLLRGARLPRLARALLARIDRCMAPRFEAYVRETSALLSQVGTALEGIHPAGEPDPSTPDAARLPMKFSLPQSLR